MSREQDAGRVIAETMAFLRKQRYEERNPEVLRTMAEGREGGHWKICAVTTREVQELLEKDKKDEAIRILGGRLNFLHFEAPSVESQAETLSCIWDMSCSLAKIYMGERRRGEAEEVLNKAIKRKMDLGWVVGEDQWEEKRRILSNLGTKTI